MNPQRLPYRNLNKLMYSLIPLHRSMKYLEREGINDLGNNYWNKGKTAEIKERVLHLK